MLLIDFDFTYLKRCNFLNFTSRYGKFNQEICTKFYHNRPGFVNFISKNILVCFFRRTVYIYRNKADRYIELALPDIPTPSVRNTPYTDKQYTYTSPVRNHLWALYRRRLVSYSGRVGGTHCAEPCVINACLP